MKKNMRTKVLAVAMSLAMCLSMFPAAALAEETAPIVATTQQEETQPATEPVPAEGEAEPIAEATPVEEAAPVADETQPAAEPAPVEAEAQPTTEETQAVAAEAQDIAEEAQSAATEEIPAEDSAAVIAEETIAEDGTGTTTPTAETLEGEETAEEEAPAGESGAQTFAGSGTVEVTNMKVTLNGVDYPAGGTDSAMPTTTNTFSVSMTIGGDSACTGRTIAIDIPLGWRLVSGPGVASVGNNKINTKAYVPTESAFLDGFPTWVADTRITQAIGYDLWPKSGTLTYKLKEGTVGSSITLVLQAEDTLYNYSGEQTLKDITATMKGTFGGSEVTDTKAVGAKLGNLDMSTARVSITSVASANTAVVDNTYAYLGRTQTMWISAMEDCLWTEVGDIAKTNPSKYAYNAEFDYTYPKGTTIAIHTNSISTWEMVGAPTDNGDTYTQHFKVKANKLTIRATDAAASGRFACKIDVTFPKDAGLAVGTKYNTKVTNFTWQTATVNADEGFEWVTHTAVNTMSSATDTTLSTSSTTIIPDVPFDPPYWEQTMNNESKNGYDGKTVTLFAARTGFKVNDAHNNSNVQDSITGTSTTPIRVCYKGSDLDNSSYVQIATPVKTTDTLTKIYIKFNDDTGTVVEWTPGSGTMPGTIDYHAVANGRGNSWQYTAPEGQYVAEAYLEFSEVSADDIADLNYYSRCNVQGRPKNDKYTGTFSHHEFYTQQWQDSAWVTVSSSNIPGEEVDNYQGFISVNHAKNEHGGFRWQKPDEFKLTATGTSLNAVNSYDGIGRVGGEYAQIPAQPGNITLASYTFSNATGSFAEAPIRIDYDFNQTPTAPQDKVTGVHFPVPYMTEIDDSTDYVTKLEWKYEGDETLYTWQKGDPGTPPFTVEHTTTDSYGAFSAEEGKTLADFTAYLSDWNASTVKPSASIIGSPTEIDRYTESSSHKITISTLDEAGAVTAEVCNSSAGFQFRVSTQQKVTPTGTKVEINAGETGNLQVYLTPGYRDENGARGLRQEEQGYYGHSTFAFILPNELKPTADTLSVTWPNNQMQYNDTTATLKSTHVASAAEKAAANISGLDATVYVYEFDNQDITWIARYPNSSSTRPMITLPVEVDALSDDYTFSYAQLFYAGSNRGPDLNNGTALPLTGPTTAQTTYTDGVATTKSTAAQTTTNVVTDLGVTADAVRGDSTTVVIHRDPALVVQAHIAASDGNYKVYNDESPAVAAFKQDEAGTIKLDIFNTVADNVSTVKDGYVFVAIPKETGTSDQVSEHTFDFAITGAPTVVSGMENVNNIYTRYYSGDLNASITNRETIFNAASETYNADAKIVVFKLDDLKSGKGMEITIPIKAPKKVSDSVIYDKFFTRSVYLFSAEGWATYESGERYGYLRASYRHPDWTLTFDSQGGSAVAAQTVEDSATMVGTPVPATWSEPAAPTYAGLSFEGWYTDAACTAGKEFDFGTTPTADATAYAKWSANSYTVKYVTQGGTPATIADKTGVAWGDADLLPEANPTRAGYTFKEWNTAADGNGTTATATQKYSDLAANDTDTATTLYAIWTELPDVTINYVSANTVMGTVVKDTETVHPASSTGAGTTATASTGYHFVKWTKASDNTWEADGATLGDTQLKTDGVYVAETYTANFAPNTDTLYKVFYYQQNLTDDGYTQTEQAKSAATTATAPTIDSKTYTGFTYKETTYEATGITASTAPLTIAGDGSLVVKVYYTRNAHTVTYNNKGHGTTPSAVSGVKFGAALTDPGDLTAAGYTFGGWFTDEACSTGKQWNFTTGTMPDNDMTLFAKWTPNTYKVNFAIAESDTAKATLSNSSEQSVTYKGNAKNDCTCNITPPAVLGGDTFELIGWRYDYIAADGTAKKGVASGATGYASVEVLGDVTFTAVIYKTPFVTASATNGKVSIAQTVDAPAEPTNSTAAIEGIGYDDLPITAAVKFAPGSENYALQSVTVHDFADTQNKVTFTDTDLARTDDVVKTLTTTDKDSAAVTVTVTANFANKTIVTDKTIGTSIEFEVVYAPIQTTYTVEHYRMGTDGNYPTAATESDTLPLGGTKIDAGSVATFTPKNGASNATYAGTTYDSTKTTYQDSASAAASATVLPVRFDGSTVIRLYYARNKHNVTFNANGHGTNPTGLTGVYTGAAVTAPTNPTAYGYTGGGWYTDSACTDGKLWDFSTGTMPDSDLTLYYKWTEDADVTITYESNNTDMGTVSRATENVAPATGTPQGSTATAKTGYHFVNWVLKDTTTEKGTTNTLTPARNTNGIYEAANYQAVFAPNTNTAYVVRYYQQNTADDNYTEVTADKAEKTGTTGGDAVVDAKTYTGFATTPAKTTYAATGIPAAETVLTIAADGSLVVCVYYDRTTATVTFDANTHGTAPAAQTVRYNGTATKPADPTEDGYTFGGWYTEAECTTAYDFATQITADKTVYAKWTENDVTINYVSANLTLGTVSPASETIKIFNGSVSGSTATASTGYHFVKWTNAVNTQVGTDAKYVPTKTDDKNVAATYTAHFEANSYTVAFDKNGGTGDDMTDQRFTYDETQNLTANSYTRAGYTFLGWNTDKDATTASYTDTQSVSNLTAENNGTVTLYAIWSENGNVTLTYTATTGGSVSPAAESVKPSTGKADGSKATADAGYHFVNWTVGDTTTVAGTDATLTAAQVDAIAKTSGIYVATTFTANNAPNTYTVEFKANGGTGTAMPDQRFTYDEAQALTTNTYTRDGYSFLGWSTDASATDKTYSNEQSVTNLTTANGGTVTLNAIWSENDVTINYVSADTAQGSVSRSTETVKAKTQNVAGSTATPVTGYHFVKWTDKNSASVSTDATLVPAKVNDLNVAATYTANFAPNTYTVTFDANGGTGKAMDDQSFTYDVTQAVTTNTYSREGYNFLGWSTDKNATTALYADKQSVSNLTNANDGNVKLFAIWSEKDNVNLTYTAKTGGSVSPVAESVAPATGEAVGSTATADPGYHFVNWTIGELLLKSVAGTDAVLTAAQVDAKAKKNDVYVETNFTANFAENDKVTINYVTDPATPWGTVTVADEKVAPATGTAKGSTAKANAGYHFVGWTNADGVIITDMEALTTPKNSDKIYEAATYTAHFAPNTDTKYLVQYYQQNVADDNYTEMTDDKLDKIGTTDAAIDATVLGNTYTGFAQSSVTYEADGKPASSAVLAVQPDGSLIVKIYYNRNTHTVHYDAQGHGTAPADVTDVRYGATLSTPATPTAEGYTFGGWYTDAACTDAAKWDFANGIMPDSEMTLYVKWIANSYTITFDKNTVTVDANGNAIPLIGTPEGTTDDQAQTYDVSAPLNPNGYSLAGYEFAGWNTAADGSGTAYADGAPVKELTTQNGATVKLYAQWKPHTYTITFDKNSTDATGTTADMTATYGTETALTANAFTRPGYVFAGWATKADADTVEYADSAKVTSLSVEQNGAVTLYAVWTQLTPVVDDPPIEKKVVEVNEKTTEPGTFTFEMKPVSNTAGLPVEAMPMPSGTPGKTVSKTILGPGAVEFGNITFTREGTYVYELSEVNLGNKRYKYDDNVIRVTYEIAKEGTALTSTRTMTDKNDKTYESAVFTNDYINQHFTIIFDVGEGSVQPEPQIVEFGDTIVPPVDPVKEGNIFTGWEKPDGEKYDFNTPVTGPISLQAGWEAIVAPKPKEEGHGDIGEAMKNGTWGKPDGYSAAGATDAASSAAAKAAAEAAYAARIPKTNDDAPITLVVILLVVAAAGFGIFAVLKKRKQNEDAKKPDDTKKD